MYRHFYPVMGTFVGERTYLKKKKRTFWVHFSKKGTIQIPVWLVFEFSNNIAVILLFHTKRVGPYFATGPTSSKPCLSMPCKQPTHYEALESSSYDVILFNNEKYSIV